MFEERESFLPTSLKRWSSVELTEDVNLCLSFPTYKQGNEGVGAGFPPPRKSVRIFSESVCSGRNTVAKEELTQI